MYLLGSFVTQQFTDPTVLADVDFFAFPTIAEANGQDAVEAPIDGFMVSKKGGEQPAPPRPCWSTSAAPTARTPTPRRIPSNVATNLKADFSKLNADPEEGPAGDREREGRSRQFLDRDALPAFANNVMIPALQGFIEERARST